MRYFHEKKRQWIKNCENLFHNSDKNVTKSTQIDVEKKKLVTTNIISIF